MNYKQSNQSVKDILEDIKKAISGKSSSNDAVEIEKEKKDDDVLYLEEEYLEDSEKDSKEQNNEKQDVNNDHKSEEIVFNNTQFNNHSYNSQRRKGRSVCTIIPQTDNNKGITVAYKGKIAIT
ncbi:Predicted protein [Wolbachia endosymbiont strain TRS of Brugia malayi]|uniref:hypothetical protein n=1 Tax=Wolbachia endosymbiont of Brugia malayi TaxID=80849 RepID=UPI00004C944C|nr:hypothetical protein [Wolbachia endosymbiont of Brugia malayi]AAW71164.1 Predicted protein [Wolbachia endosymbiont strain TRS of Brugia malayi]